MWLGHRRACGLRTQLRQLVGDLTRQQGQRELNKLQGHLVAAGFPGNALTAGSHPRSLAPQHYQVLATARGTAATQKFWEQLAEFASLRRTPHTSMSIFAVELTLGKT